ncbi:helix-turn-helix transcriptional regulator [Inhella sp.]|uniref:helix-turn-helix transcriptional regulator n=1 Tax=Inhella sp. TaxID=1921806 RepID=UPI0035B1582E
MSHQQAPRSTPFVAPAPVPVAGNWMSGVLDELDVGIVIADVEGQLVHANRRARHELTADHPLQLFAGRVRAREACDVAPLHNALAGAAQGGRRRLLTLDAAGEALALAVVPVPEQPELVMLLLSRRHLGERCMLQWFATQHGLTPCEHRVLEALSDGDSPEQIAQKLSVGIATVRSHIGSLRAKVGAPSIRALLHRVASLPPMAQRLPS